MNRRLFIILVSSILLCSGVSFNRLQAMGAAEVVLAEEIAEKAGMEVAGTAFDEVMGKVGSFEALSVEEKQMVGKALGGFKELGLAPEEVQVAAGKGLVEGLSVLQKEGLSGAKLISSENFSGVISSNVKNKVLSEMNGLSAKGVGLSPLEYESASKFIPENAVLDRVPVKAPAQMEIAKANGKVGFNEGVPTPFELEVSEAENLVESSQRDLAQAVKMGDLEKIKQYQGLLDSSKTALNEAGGKLQGELASNVSKTETVAKNFEKTYQAKTQNGTASVGDRANINNAEGAAGKAEGDAKQAENKTAFKQYNQAVQTKEGTGKGAETVNTAKKNLATATKEAQGKAEGSTEQMAKTKAQDELAKAKRSPEAGTANNLTQAKEDMNVLMKKKYPGTKLGADYEQIAKDDLAAAKVSGDPEKISSAQKNYDEFTTQNEKIKNLTEANLKATEDVDTFGAQAQQKGQFDFFSKDNFAQYGVRAKAFGWEQITNGLVMGFSFSVPNLFVSKWQSMWNNMKNRDATKEPQWYGDMWMQIPSQLISASDKVKSGAPLAVKYLYVGLEKTGENVKRDDTINLKTAQFFMLRDDYDGYATAGIGDPNAPDKMVHLNTGFHFYSDGISVPKEGYVQFLGTLGSEQQWARQPLQSHLDEQAGEIFPGTGGYAGSQDIADQFESDKNKDFIAKEYPQLGGDDGFGSVLNGAITALMNGVYFEKTYKVQAFKALDANKALDKTTLEAIGVSSSDYDNLPQDKPWIAYGKYIYQTADTSNVKSVQKKLIREGKTKLAENIVEYVLMVDNESNIVPLQIPQPNSSSKYNFPSCLPNPLVTKMLSLYDGLSYSGGKAEDSKIDVVKLAGSYFPEGVVQIDAMNAFIQEQLQDGPFVIGDKTVEIIDKNLQDQGIYIYKIADNDGVAEDYVVATFSSNQGTKVIKLPGAPTNFVSLVTSRIYDNELVPYDYKSGGRIEPNYYICKIDETTPPLVVAGSCKSPIIPITNGLKAPLYSLFMDPDVNPNKIPSTAVVVADLTWLDTAMGGNVTWPQPPPVPVQWALSPYGPAGQVDANGAKVKSIGAMVPADLRTTIDGVYNSWKKTHSEMTDDQREALSTFAWVDTVPPITLRVTSKEDVDNANHVYTSPFYPDEYFVLSNDEQGTLDFAQEYSVAAPQAYLISLSSGNVYGRAQKGEMVGSSTKSLETLLADAQKEQGAFRPQLLDAIKKSQDAYVSVLQGKQYGPDTAFGRFQFYLYPEDLKSGQYVYADVTNSKDPLSLTEQQLMDQVTDYYVAISLKEGIAEGDKDKRDLDPANWIYGNALGANTIRVVSLVNGVLYDRGGGYQGYFKPFADNLASKNLDIQSGFLNIIMSYLASTWSSEGKAATMRAALQTKITSLLATFYQQLLAEKAEIEKAVDEESKLYAPMSPNTIANIEAQPYVDSLLTFSPVRYVKNYQGKYYMIIPEQTFAEKTIAPKIYVDYNVGDAGKDNGLGVYYGSDGTALLRMTGWPLENARAYAGIVVGADGSQTLDVSVDHPAIPVDGMVALDNVATLKTRLITAWSAYKNALSAKNVEQARAAADKVANAQQEYEGAKVANAAQLASGLKIYFNETTDSYFMEVAGTRYIDLTSGYQFYKDGTPKLFESPLLINSDTAKSGKMFLGLDQHDLLKVQYMTDRLEIDSPYSSWYTYDTALDYVNGEKFPRYTLASSANNLDTLYVYNDKTAGQYYVYMKKWDEADVVFTGTLIPDKTLKYSLLRHFRTRTTGKTEGTFVEDRELDPTYIVWDGTLDLKLQKLYYRNYLLDLSGTDNTTFTATFNVGSQTRTITVKKQIKAYGSTKAHYLTIIDGTNEYDFSYDSSILDPEMPTNCQAEGTEILKLNYWKQCAWNMNVVADAFGVIRLVKGTSLDTIVPVQPADSDRVKQQAKDQKLGRESIVSSNLGKISYDPTNNRYLYRLSSSDSTWQYYQSRWNGWYADLSNGILYTTVTPNGDLYPLGSLQASQLYVLLDKLEVSVGHVKVAGGDPLYKSNGDPVTDTSGPVFTKSGLVYRSQKIIQTDDKGNIVKTLNPAIIGRAQESNTTQF